MHDAVVVEIGDGRDDVAHELGGLAFSVRALLDDLVKQLAARHELHDNVHLVLGFKQITHRNDVLVLDAALMGRAKNMIKNQIDKNRGK
jgi:hypothetical protein